MIAIIAKRDFSETNTYIVVTGMVTIVKHAQVTNVMQESVVFGMWHGCNG